MDSALTAEQALALAPDGASAKAAAGLASDRHWASLGGDADAVWGECKGSGAKPYQAQVDLAALVSRCSCPSRKFPCKHALALLLMHARGGIAAGARPAWVEEWLNSRRERAGKKEQAAAKAAAAQAADPEAAAAAAGKREAARWKRIDQGTAELQRWIGDQLRRGLASFGPQQRAEWTAMAARMVDAQAPALSAQLLAATEAMAAGVAAVPAVVERFGLIWLLREAVVRRDALSPPRLADVRTALGWVYDKDDLATLGERVGDRWIVQGQRIDEREDRLFERRVWLRGQASGRDALLHDYAYGGRGWEHQWLDGRSVEATLCFFPGSAPLRALALEQGAAQPARRWSQPAAEAVEAASRAFAANPWLPWWPLALADAVPLREAERWWLHTPAGRLPLAVGEAAGWNLLAHSGGAPLRVMGEWDGRELRPLSAWRGEDAAQDWSLAA